jgi:hypothetical protein
MAELHDEELEVELDDEENKPDGEGGEGGGEEQSGADGKLAALQAEIDELRKARSGGGDNPQMSELIELGKKFFNAQVKPTGDPAADKAQRAAYGKRLKDLVLTGDDEEIAAFFVSSVDEIADRKVNAALERVGTPMADKAGAFALQMFLEKKREEVPERVHKVVAKNFSITDADRRALATASAADVSDFLEAKYERAAGKVLLGSGSRIASPRGMGGAGGGAGGASNVITFPGMSAAESKRFEEWAAELWPDEKVRAAKVKSTIDRMKAEREAS